MKLLPTRSDPHENVFVVADPGRVFCQSTHYRLVQATLYAIVDVLHTGRSSQLGRFQPSRQRLVLAPTPLLIDQQRESFEETQLVDRSILLLRFQGLDHALQPHGQQFFHHRLVQHEVGPPWSKYSAPRTLSWVRGGEPGCGGDISHRLRGVRRYTSARVQSSRSNSFLGMVRRISVS